MRFYIILCIDIPRSEYIRAYSPSKSIRRKLRLTEGDEQFEYGHLGGEWEKGKHRKYVGELSRKDFESVVSDCGLMAESTTTGGALIEDGFMPTMSFFSEHPVALVNAFVTPIPEVEMKGMERDWEAVWERVSGAVYRTYRYGV